MTPPSSATKQLTIHRPLHITIGEYSVWNLKPQCLEGKDFHSRLDLTHEPNGTRFGSGSSRSTRTGMYGLPAVRRDPPV